MKSKKSKWYRHNIKVTFNVPFITQSANPTKKELKKRVEEMDPVTWKDDVNYGYFSPDVDLNESEEFDSEEEADEG